LPCTHYTGYSTLILFTPASTALRGFDCTVYYVGYSYRPLSRIPGRQEYFLIYSFKLKSVCLWCLSAFSRSLFCG